MAEVLLVFMRWLHIASVATLVGGLLYGTITAAALLPAETRFDQIRRSAERFRPFAVAAIAGLLISGIFNILNAPGHSSRYHMLLGIKLLLALHVFAVALLLVTGKARRPSRSMTGAAISGFIIIAISAYLRRIF